MLKTTFRNVFGVGMQNAIRNLRTEFGIQRMHRAGVKAATKYRERKLLKLHFGCGRNIKAGFVNIDADPHADLGLDLRESLPFDNGSCSLIYSEHFLEHVVYPDVIGGLLTECHRVLQKGGIFSVGVPDTEWALMEYCGLRDEGYFKLAKELWHPEWCSTEMEHLNYHFRQGEEHKFAYDFKTMERALHMVGFTKVRRRPFDSALDQESRAKGTLYVDAVKE